MNFYKRFVADIQVKTGHLTPAEFGIYDRLLDHYYATEAPLPAALDRCCAIARAMTKADREATARVLGEFFTLEATGYAQRRADEMIAEAQPKIEAARTNGKRGGRPRNNQTGTQQKPNGLSVGTQHEPDAKASQSQSSSIEEQPPTGVQGAGRASRRCPPSFEPSVMAIVSMQAECPGVDLDRELRKFRDWEFQKPRKDWPAAWRTWMRKAFDDLPKAGNETPYQRSMRERAAEIHPAIARAAPGSMQPNPMEILDGLATPLARIAR